jgi:hypothetical protein
MEIDLREHAFWMLNGETDFKSSYDLYAEYEEGFKTLYPTYKDLLKAIKDELKINKNDAGNYAKYEDQFFELFSTFSTAKKEPLSREDLNLFFSDRNKPRKNWEKVLVQIKELAHEAFVSYDYLAEQTTNFSDGYAENLAGFSVSEANIENIRIEGSIADVRNWKAKNLFGSNGGKIGEWDNVGYVGISIDSDIVVPVPRGDEHRAGYEYIYGAMRRKLIPKGDYISIWALETGNYFYADYESIKNTNEGLAHLLIAIEKYFSYGGKDSPLKLYGQGQFTDQETTMSEFLRSGGLKNTKKDIPMPTELDESAELLLEDLRMFSNVSLDTIKNEKKIMKLGEKILRDLEDIIRFDVGGEFKQLLKIPMEEAYGSDSSESMVGNILGLAGVKNRLHTYLKKLLKNGKEKDIVIANALFGSLKSMVDELNALGNI